MEGSRASVKGTRAREAGSSSTSHHQRTRPLALGVSPRGLGKGARESSATVILQSSALLVFANYSYLW